MRFRVMDRVKLIKGVPKKIGFVEAFIKGKTDRVILSFSKEREKDRRFKRERKRSYSVANLRQIDENGSMTKLFLKNGWRRYRSTKSLSTGDINRLVSDKRRIFSKASNNKLNDKL